MEKCHCNNKYLDADAFRSLAEPFSPHRLNVEFFETLKPLTTMPYILNASPGVIWVHSVSFISSQGAVKSHRIIIGFIYKVRYVSVSAQKAWSRWL